MEVPKRLVPFDQEQFTERIICPLTRTPCTSEVACVALASLQPKEVLLHPDLLDLASKITSSICVTELLRELQTLSQEGHSETLRNLAADSIRRFAAVQDRYTNPHPEVGMN